MEAIVAWIMAHEWAVYVTAVVTIASAVMTVLPSSLKDHTWYNVVMKFVNTLAFNFGKAKSADDKIKIKVE